MSLFRTINPNSMPQNNQSNTLQNIMQSRNPQQLAMQMLQQQCPDKFKMVQSMMSQGMNPQMAMQQLGISQQQIDAIKSIGGLKI